VLVPVIVQRRTLRFELPAMTAAALALLFLSLNGMLGRAEGVPLVAGGAAYTLALLRISRRDSPNAAGEEVAAHPQGGDRPLRAALSLLAGMAVIVLGAELLVEGAVSSAESLGVSGAVRA
jgi:cation:H+ antiporter